MVNDLMRTLSSFSVIFEPYCCTLGESWTTTLPSDDSHDCDSSVFISGETIGVKFRGKSIDAVDDETSENVSDAEFSFSSAKLVCRSSAKVSGVCAQCVDISLR